MNTINTINDLRNLVGTPGESILLLGYYTAGDKTSLVYLCKPGTFTDNGGDIIVPNSTTGKAWVAASTNSIEDYGAIAEDPSKIDLNFSIFRRLVESKKSVILLDKTYYIGTANYEFSLDSSVKEVRILGQNLGKNSGNTNIVTLNKNLFVLKSEINIRIISIGVRYWGNQDGNHHVTASIFEYVGAYYQLDINFTLIMKNGGIFYAKKGFYTRSYSTACRLEDVRADFNEYFFYSEQESNTSIFKDVHLLNNRVGVWGFGYQFSMSDMELAIRCHPDTPDSSNTGQRIGIYCPQGHIEMVYMEDYVNPALEPMTDKHIYIYKHVRNAEIDTLHLRYIGFNQEATSPHHDIYMTSDFLSVIEANVELINITAENEAQIPTKIGVREGKHLLGVKVNGNNRYYIKDKILFNRTRHHKILFPLQNGLDATISESGIDARTLIIKPSNIEGITFMPNFPSTVADNYYYYNDNPSLNSTRDMKVIYNFQMPVDLPDKQYCLLLRFGGNLKRIDFSRSTALPGGTNMLMFQGEAFFNKDEVVNVFPLVANLGFDTSFNVPTQQNLANAKGYFEVFNLY